MRIRRDHIVRAGLGGTAVLALALAVTGAWWLPRRAEALRSEAVRLGAALSAAAPNRPVAVPEGGVPVPGAEALPARAAAVVDGVRRQGVDPVHYELGARAVHGTLASQPLTVSFEAGFPVVTRVLVDLANLAPAVAVQRVDLERGDGGLIEVAVRLDLLGGPVPAKAGGR